MGISDHTISGLSAETCLVIQQGYKEKGVQYKRPCVSESCGNVWDVSVEKLAPIWEWPYRVTTIDGAGAYYLEDMEERPFSWPWNVQNLNKFYY